MRASKEPAIRILRYLYENTEFNDQKTYKTSEELVDELSLPKRDVDITLGFLRSDDLVASGKKGDKNAYSVYGKALLALSSFEQLRTAKRAFWISIAVMIITIVAIYTDYNGDKEWQKEQLSILQEIRDGLRLDPRIESEDDNLHVEDNKSEDSGFLSPAQDRLRPE